MLAPFRRAVFNIPFLYQKISSTSPVQVVISANSSLAVVHMDGSTDWTVVGRALLAWTGQTISIKPTRDRRASLAKRGNSEVTGRGLLAITGQGSVYQVVLAAEEKYLLHPSNVLAYTINSKPPVPYRLQSSTFRLHVPEIKLPSFFASIKFFTVMQQTATWRIISQLFSKLRTWTRRVIWGERLFLQFHGPTTVLLQSRSPKLSESFSDEEIDQVVKLPPVATQEAAKQPLSGTKEERVILQENKAPRMSLASIGSDGKVKIEAVKV
ncbi:Altered inheritance of mitochondria protein 24, mitochondrial [Peltigera leucophlebia]|nr:Altered inheritance of mitochondria protein 24, mitochondrial [Peltigera leucophlebia]